MKRRIALSPSRVNDYHRCPLLYRFRAIDRLPEPKTKPQVKGTLVHACLEDLHKLPRPLRDYPAAVKRLKPNWATMCENDPELLELIPEEDTYDFLCESRALLKGYFHLENPQGFDAHACEMYVDTVLPNGVPVRGFIDRVDAAPTGQVRVVDYKTGKKPAPQFEHDARLQMQFYALVYWRLYDVVPEVTRLLYLKSQAYLDATPTRSQLERLEVDLGELWDTIVSKGRTGDFQPKVNNLCSWCQFQELCPAKGGTLPPYPGWPED